MIIASAQSQMVLNNKYETITANLDEWQLVTIRVPPLARPYRYEIVNELLQVFQNNDGLVIPVDTYKVVVMVKMGRIENFSLLKRDIEKKLWQREVGISVRRLTEQAVLQFRSDAEGISGNKFSLYREREDRKESHILVADDDDFIRMTLRKGLSKDGQIHEVDNGAKVVQAYLNCNPDIVFIDIHMPQKDGLTIIRELVEVDPDACIVVMSSDSIKDNIMDALSYGANGFLAKPLLKEKLLAHLRKCETISTGYVEQETGLPNAQTPF